VTRRGATRLHPRIAATESQVDHSLRTWVDSYGSATWPGADRLRPRHDPAIGLGTVLRWSV